jgi:hypothetical protein
MPEAKSLTLEAAFVTFILPIKTINFSLAALRTRLFSPALFGRL